MQQNRPRKARDSCDAGPGERRVRLGTPPTIGIDGDDGIDISRRKQRLEGDSTKVKMRGRGRAQTLRQSKVPGGLVMEVTSVPESRVVLTLKRSAPAPIIANPCFPRLTPVLAST